MSRFEPPARRHDNLLGTAAVALAAALWAGAAVIAKSLFEDGVEAIELSEARSYTAFAGLLLIHGTRRATGRGQDTPGAIRPIWLQLFGIGVAIALVNAAYYVAIDRLEVAVAIVIQYTAPALVVVWMAISLRRLPPAKTVAAVVAATIGVALAAKVTEADLGALNIGGLLAASASAFLFATYTLLSESVSRAIGAMRTMLWAFGAATLFWLCFQIPQGWPHALTDSDNIFRVLVVGVVGTLMPFLLYVWGIRRVAAEKAVIAATLEPPLAALAAWVWLNESLSPTQIAGGALVLVAIAVLQTKGRPTPAAKEPVVPA